MVYSFVATKYDCLIYQLSEEKAVRGWLQWKVYCVSWLSKSIYNKYKSNRYKSNNNGYIRFWNGLFNIVYTHSKIYLIMIAYFLDF